MREGVDGFTVNVFLDRTVNNNNPMNSAMPNFFAAADNYADFKIAACLDPSPLIKAGYSKQENEAIIITAVEIYYNLAVSHKSAAWNDTKLVLFVYHNKYLATDSWQRIKDHLEKENMPIYWVGDVAATQNGAPPVNTVLQEIKPYTSLFNVGYSFGPLRITDPSHRSSDITSDFTDPDKNYWQSITDFFSANKKPWAGGTWPGYYRGYGIPMAYGPFGSDAMGTYLYRFYWQRHLGAHLPWINITTWNAFLEHTIIAPDSDYNYTRADLTAWYSSSFKGQHRPFQTAHLYITTPQALYLGQQAPAEALVLNPTSSKYMFTIQLFDGNHTPVGESKTATIEANSQATVSISLGLSTVPAGGFLRAYATLQSYARLQSFPPTTNISEAVTSAPIIIYDEPTPKDNHAPPNYYSIPAYKAIKPEDGVKLTIANHMANVKLLSKIDARFVDVLHDTNLVKTFDGFQTQYMTPIPGDFITTTYTDDNYYERYRLANPTIAPNYRDQGIYVARIIDQNGNVGYSDPVFTTINSLPIHGISLRNTAR